MGPEVNASIMVRSSPGGGKPNVLEYTLAVMNISFAECRFFSLECEVELSGRLVEVIRLRGD